MDGMETLFTLLKQETEPAARAVLGHFLFVFIHPYPDGNGRLGRFLMNAMLASGGYPWAVIRLKRRQQYMKVLEQASACTWFSGLVTATKGVPLDPWDLSLARFKQQEPFSIHVDD